MVQSIFRLALFVLLLIPPTANAQDEFAAFRAAEAANARILMWRGRLKEERLDKQLTTFKQKRIPILPLAEIFAQTLFVQGAGKLPNRAAGLVFDISLDRFQQLVWPKLRKAKLPATLLIDPDAVEPNSAALELLRLTKTGISIGLKLPENISHKEAKARHATLQKLAGEAPIVLLQGEGVHGDNRASASLSMMPQLVTDNGVVEPQTARDSVPSFVVSHIDQENNRFSAILNALPLPVTGITPGNRVLDSAGANPPAFGFTVAAGLDDRLGGLTCRSTGNNKTSFERLGPYRIEVRLARRFSPGLHRIDCLMPGSGTRGNVRWRWFGARFRVER